MTRVLVVPRQNTYGWPLHADAPPCVAHELGDALTREWPSDAHIAAYEAPPHARRLTINGEGGRRIYERGVTVRVGLLAVDVDDPVAHGAKPKIPARDEWRAVERAKVARLLADHPGIVVYETRGGYRLLARLAVPHEITTRDDADAWARWYLRALGYLSRAFDVIGDPACIDWTRLYRLPHATRAKLDGSPGDAPERRPVYGLLDAVGTWTRDDANDADDAELHRLAREVGGVWASKIQHVAAPIARAPRARAARSRAPDTTVVQMPAVGPLAAAITAAIAELPRGTGAHHRARLAVVATLRANGWHRSAIERVVGALADATGKPRDAHIAELVPSTLARVDADLPALGEAHLREHARGVHEALVAHIETADAAARWARRLGSITGAKLVSRDDAAQVLLDTYARARVCGGLVQVQCTAGAGKTYAAVCEAVTAARAGQRTALLAPSHAVAREMLAALRVAGVEAHHLASVASHETDGAPTCHHHRAAKALASGGVSIVPTLCEGYGYGARDAAGQRRLPVIASTPPPNAPCEHRDACSAYADATSGIPGGALVLVGVHQHAAVAHRWLREGGGRALLVVDEAPRLLDAERWTGAELLTLAEIVRAGVIVAAERDWRAELLTAAAHGLRAASAKRLVDLLVGGLVSQGIEQAVAENTVATWAHGAIVDGNGRARASMTPRPARRLLVGLRGGGKMPDGAARALRVCGMLARALAHETGARPDRVFVSVATRDWGPNVGEHELRVGAIVEALAGALCDPSIGRVLLDATADPRLVEPYTGKIEQVRVDVADGAQVHRLFVPWSHGTRRHLLDKQTGAVRWNEAASPIGEAVALAVEQVPTGGVLAVVGYQAVVAELRRAWEAPDGCDARVARVLAPLRARGITPAWGHYGALRGRNDWRHADALVCLGTPYPPVAEIEQIAAAAELHDAIRDVGLHEARAEIEQAVARLRAPQRTTSTAVVVLATVPPLHADARWKVRALATGRPSTADGAELVSLAERMSVADAAAAAGVSERTVQRARARARAQAHTPNGGVTEGVAEAPTTGCVTPPSGPPPPIATPATHSYSPPLRSTRPDDDSPTVASARCGGCALAPSRVASG